MIEQQAITPVSTPRIRRKPATRPRSIRLPQGYWQALDKIANKHGDSVNNLVLIAVRERWIEEPKP